MFPRRIENGIWILMNDASDVWTGQTWVVEEEDALVFRGEEEALDHLTVFRSIMEGREHAKSFGPLFDF